MKRKNGKIDYTDPTPWTWGEIAALEGAELERFLLAYGGRGKAATRIAHKGNVCSWNSFHVQWSCKECPMDKDPQNHVEWDCRESSRRVYDHLCADGNVYPEVFP